MVWLLLGRAWCALIGCQAGGGVVVSSGVDPLFLLVGNTFVYFQVLQGFGSFQP